MGDAKPSRGAKPGKYGSWLSSRNFFEGDSVVMLISIIMLIFYCFRTNFKGAKVSERGRLLHLLL